MTIETNILKLDRYKFKNNFTSRNIHSTEQLHRKITEAN